MSREPFWASDNTIVIEPASDSDLDFLYYLLLAADLNQHAGGAAQPLVTQTRLKAHSVRLPDPAVRSKISSVLRTVDDLIGNNRRRVELLEQMAQAIYREWFVHFRYPGHEDATLVDFPLGPIPAGWQVITFGDALELHYGRALKAGNRRGGHVAVVGSSDVVGWHDEEFLPGPAIVVGRKGNVGKVVWVAGPCWPIDTTYYVRTELPLRYVAEQLKRAEFINTHAAVPASAGIRHTVAHSCFLLATPWTTSLPSQPSLGRRPRLSQCRLSDLLPFATCSCRSW